MNKQLTNKLYKQTDELIYIVAIEIAMADKKFSRTEVDEIINFVSKFYNDKNISKKEIIDNISFYSHFKLNFLNVDEFPKKLKEKVFKFAFDVAQSDSHFKLSELHKLIEIGKTLKINRSLINKLLTEEEFKWNISFKVAEFVTNAIYKNKQDKIKYTIHIIKNILTQVDLTDTEVYNYYLKYSKTKLNLKKLSQVEIFVRDLLLNLTYELNVNPSVSVKQAKLIIAQLGQILKLNQVIVDEAVDYCRFRPIFIIASESILADGVVSVEEIHYLFELMKKITNNQLADTTELYKYLHLYGNDKLSTKEIKKIPYKFREALFLLAVNIMKSDKKITFKEFDKLKEIANRLKISPKFGDAVIFKTSN